MLKGFNIRNLAADIIRYDNLQGLPGSGAELLGIAATPQMVEAAEAAQKVLDERKRKREERERATIAAGRGVFVEKKTEAAGRAFDRLCEKYAPQAEDTPATEAEAVEVAEAVAA